MLLLSFIPAVILIIGLGWSLRRIDFLKRDDVEVINKIIVYVSLPALIFMAVHNASLSLKVARLPVFAIIVMAVCLVIGYAAGKLIGLKNGLLGAFLLVAAIGNTGYLGFPLTIGLYGQHNLVKSVFYDFGTVTFLFTAGIVVARSLGNNRMEGSVIREFLLFPSTLALLAGLVFHFIPLPVFLDKAFEYLGQATIPLVMLTIGLTLEAKSLKKYIWLLLLVLVVKLLISPLIALGLAAAGGFTSTDLGILVLEASMPAVMLSLVVGLKYDLEVEFISAAILVSIIASLATIPLFQTIVRMI
jgi:predicted permease